MIIQWIKSIIKPAKVDPSKEKGKKEEQEIIDLLDFLWKKIDWSPSTSGLKGKIKTFKGLSLEKKIKELPATYLLLEQHLLKKNINEPKKKQSIRKAIIAKHQELLKYENFKIIFKPHKEQELILCKVFLSEVLEKSSELVGNFKEKEILEIKKHLDSSYDFHEIDIIKERKRLLEFSNEIFLKIKNSLGINTITNTYLHSYKEHFESYNSLDSFTAILNVIPEEILSKDLIDFPSKQQMLKMLQKQLLSLEEINERLTKEVVERKKVAIELKYSEHLNTTILETAMDGIILVNSAGIVLNWNKQAENILSIKRSETIGESIFPLVPKKLRQELQISFTNYIRIGYDELINKRVETSILRKDGSIVYIELTIIAIETKDDYLFNAFFRDITNRRIIDTEIREAKVVAEKSTKAKSVFLSNMSHEIRTPLNVILGLTSILQKSNFTNLSVDRKNLDGIQFSAENLLVLINDILDFSKIEAGKLTLYKADFNLHELIIKISRGIEIKANEKGLQYKMIIDPKIPKFIIGDQLRLNQILINLLGNAVKFTQQGEIEIHVTPEKIEEKHITIKFMVKDSGVGIEQDKLDNIFESFYQVHKPGKNKIEGTGLGLSISKQLIELQKGKLNAYSKPGEGSTFFFSIRYLKSNFKSSDKIKESAKEEHDLSGMKILLVEDNTMNQFFIKQLLSHWNIIIDIADNGKIALEKIENSSYDLILMDMHMPIMDGPEAAIRIRKSKNPAIKNIPIVACSADVFPESKKKALASGMNFYLTKPLSEEALEQILFSLKPEKMPTDKNTNSTTLAPKKEIHTPILKKCDLSLLKETFDNDPEIIAGVLQIFTEETPKDHNELKAGIKNKDFASIKATSHKMKSSFKTLGLMHETEILQKMENLSKEEKGYIKIQKLANEITLSFPLIMEEVETHIKNLSS